MDSESRVYVAGNTGLKISFDQLIEDMVLYGQ